MGTNGMINDLKKCVLIYDKYAPSYLISEIEILLRILGYEVASRIQIRKEGPNYKFSEYKINQIVEELKRSGAEIVVLEPDVPPSQIILLMKKTKKDVYDRTMILLEVFERNAGSKEAKLQISLAKNKHSLPLIREFINRSKRGELPGFLAGGTYAAEKYYKYMRKQTARVRDELEEIRAKREMLRSRRKMLKIPVIAVVGYANAGKTTLFNVLTSSNKETGELPFTTLSPKIGYSRKLNALLIDTVGFVMNVPPEIIEAFYSTLEEISSSDVLLFLIDSTEDYELIEERIAQAHTTLSNINSLYKPILLVLNKIERLKEEELMERERIISSLAKEYLPNLLGILSLSAKYGIGIDKLEGFIRQALSQKQVY